MIFCSELTLPKIPGGQGKHASSSVYFHGSVRAKRRQIRAGTKGEDPRPTLVDSVGAQAVGEWA